MGYIVLTGNEEFAKAAKRNGGYDIPVEVSSVVDDTCWAIYLDNTRVVGPKPLTPTTRTEIRNALRELRSADEVALPDKAPELPAAPPPKKRAEHKERSPVEPTLSIPAVVEPARAVVPSPTPPLVDSISVTDEETGELITVDMQMRSAALATQADVKHHWESGWRHLVSLGISLKRMVDGRLYLALGFPSLEAYTRRHFAYGRHWAYDRIAIAEKLQKVGVDPASVDIYQQFPSVSQLKEAIGLQDDQFADAIRGTLPGPDGEAKPLSQMKIAEVKRLVKGESPESEPPKPDPKDAEIEAERKRREAAEKRAVELEAERTEANRRLADAAKAAAEARQEADVLRNRPPAEPEKIPVDNPQHLAEAAHWKAIAEQREAAYQTEQRSHTKLLQEVGGLEQVRKQKAEVELQKKHVEARVARLGVQFDDEGRDFYGGSKLDDSVQTLLQPLANAIAQARVIKRVGAGGTCQEEVVKATTVQLRELANLWDQIIQDRSKRWIVPEIKEVE